MIRKLKYGIEYLLGRVAPGRNLVVREDDVFVASYPKSGNTWTRFLIANLIQSHDPVTFLNIEKIIPDPDLQSRQFLERCPRPRVMKSHHPFDPRYKRVVCIVRDPRDVALSQYHFQIKRGVSGTDTPVEEFVTRFLAGETCPYGSWAQNVGSWMVARSRTPGFLLLRYEDLLRRAETELARIAGLLGIPPDPERLARAVAQSSSDRMRKLEMAQADQWTSTKETRKDLLFVRTATSGEWKSKLSPEAVERMEEAWGPLMRLLGYSTTGVEAAIEPDAAPLDFLLEYPLR